MRPTLTKLGSWEATRLRNSSLLSVLEDPSLPAYVLNWLTMVVMAASMIWTVEWLRRETKAEPKLNMYFPSSQMYNCWGEKSSTFLTCFVPGQCCQLQQVPRALSLNSDHHLFKYTCFIFITAARISGKRLTCPTSSPPVCRQPSSVTDYHTQTTLKKKKKLHTHRPENCHADLQRSNLYWW